MTTMRVFSASPEHRLSRCPAVNPDGGDMPRARREFVRGVDQVSTWVSECAALHPEYVFVNRTPIYQCYKRWAARDGYKAVKAGEFYNRLEAAGAVPAIRDGYRGFTGLMVTDTADIGGL